MALDLKKISFRKVLLVIGVFIPNLIIGQYLTGRVFSSETKSGISYVTIVVMNKNTGTVSDKAGIFILDLRKIDDNDTLGFSMIGYESQYIPAGQFISDPKKVVYLEPVTYLLKDVEIQYHKPNDIILGSPVTSNALRSGFAYNDLGSELGIKVTARRRMKFKDLHLNVAVCTYDSVTYRLNVYQSERKEEDYKNILTEPVYISFTKGDIGKELSFDLRKYSIIVEGDLLIALELYRDLGEGRLLFRTHFFTGTTYHRKTIAEKWIDASGMIGMYVHAQTMR
jgi:hypothetical protein